MGVARLYIKFIRIFQEIVKELVETKTSLDEIEKTLLNME